MLFVNFLCVYYLMVLSNGHTIPKINEYDDNSYYAFDNIEDVYNKVYIPHRGEKGHRQLRRNPSKSNTAHIKKHTTVISQSEIKTTTLLSAKAANAEMDLINNYIGKAKSTSSSPIKKFYSRLLNKFGSKNVNTYNNIKKKSSGNGNVTYYPHSYRNIHKTLTDLENDNKYTYNKREEKEKMDNINVNNEYTFTVKPMQYDYEDDSHSFFELGPTAYKGRRRRKLKKFKRAMNKSKFRHRQKRKGEKPPESYVLTFKTGKVTISLDAPMDNKLMEISERVTDNITNNWGKSSELTSKQIVNATTTAFVNFNPSKLTKAEKLNSTTTLIKSTKPTDVNEVVTPLNNSLATLTSKMTIKPMSFFNKGKIIEVNIHGTEQMEALLEEIKRRALERILNQNPDLSAIITNAVTETTFEASSMIEKHTAKRDVYEKTNPDNVDMFTPTDSMVSSTPDSMPSHNIIARSASDYVSTAAYKVESCVEKNLKGMYSKMKDKLKTDLNKEITETKEIIKCKGNDILNKVTHCSKSKKYSASTSIHMKTTANTKKVTKLKPKTKTKPLNYMKKTTTQKPKSNNVMSKLVDEDFELIEKGKSNVHNNEKIESNADDEYVMINAYEQMLNKDRTSNLFNVFSTMDAVSKKERRYNIMKHFKRRDGRTINAPERVMSNFQSVTEPSYELEYSDISTTNDDGLTATTSKDIDEISDKISYKQYVNGYKHYLKFLKEEDNQNFSNLVKFQAHRHHDVNDIGKYILEKLPPLPNLMKRDSSEATTKSNKWLKRHFYFFIETDTPKKFHSTETVTMKLPHKTSSNRDVAFVESAPAMKDMNLANINDQSHIMESRRSLDELVRVLEEENSSPASVFGNATSIETLDRTVDTSENFKIKSFLPEYFYNKLFTVGNYPTTEFRATEGDYNDNTSDNNEKVFHVKMSVDEVIDNGTSDIQSRPKKVVNNVKNRSVKLERTAAYVNPVDGKDVPYASTTFMLKSFTKHQKPKITTTAKGAKVKTKKKNKKFKNIFRKFKLHSSKNKNKVIVGKPKEKRDVNNEIVHKFCPFQKLKHWWQQQNRYSQILSVKSSDLYTASVDPYKPVTFSDGSNIEQMLREIPNITDVSEKPLLPKYAEVYNPLDKVLYNANHTVSDKTTTKTTCTCYTMPEEKNKSVQGFPYDIRTTIRKSVTSLKNPFRITLQHIQESLFPKNESHFKNLCDDEAKKPTTKYKPMTFHYETLFPKMYKTAYHYQAKDDILAHELLNDLIKKFDRQLNENFSRENISDIFGLKPVAAKPSLNKELRLHNSKDLFADHPAFTKPKTTRTTTKFNINYKSKEINDENSSAFNIMDDNYIDIFPHFINYVVKEPVTNVINTKFMYKPTTLEKTSTTLMDMAKSFKTYLLSDESSNALQPNLPLETLPTQARNIPDYFNDLLIWHSDILNEGRAKVKSWETLLKTITPTANSPTSSVPFIQLRKNNQNISNSILTEERIMKPLLQLLASKLQDSNILNTMVSLTTAPSIKAPKYNNIKISEIVSTTPQPQYKLHRKSNYTSHQKDKKFKDYIKLITSSLPSKEFKTKNTAFTKKLLALNTSSTPRIATGLRFNSNAGFRKEYHKFNELKPFGAFLIDKTLLAYDDGLHYLNERNDTHNGKLTTRTCAVHKKNHMKAKTHPRQYFTTPLPMKMGDFERFLKDNSLDVLSVTSPILHVTNYVDTWSHRKGTTNFNSNSTRTTPKTSSINLPTMELMGGKKNKIYKTDPSTLLAKHTTVKMKNNLTELAKQYFEKNLNSTPLDVLTKAPLKAPYESMPYMQVLKKEQNNNTVHKSKRKLFKPKSTRKSFSVDTEYNDNESLLTRPYDKDNHIEVTVINLEDANKNYNYNVYHDYDAITHDDNLLKNNTVHEKPIMNEIVTEPYKYDDLKENSVKEYKKEDTNAMYNLLDDKFKSDAASIRPYIETTTHGKTVLGRVLLSNNNNIFNSNYERIYKNMQRNKLIKRTRQLDKRTMSTIKNKRRDALFGFTSTNNYDSDFMKTTWSPRKIARKLTAMPRRTRKSTKTTCDGNSNNNANSNGNVKVNDKSNCKVCCKPCHMSHGEFVYDVKHYKKGNFRKFKHWKKISTLLTDKYMMRRTTTYSSDKESDIISRKSTQINYDYDINDNEDTTASLRSNLVIDRSKNGNRIKASKRKVYPKIPKQKWPYDEEFNITSPQDVYFVVVNNNSNYLKRKFLTLNNLNVSNVDTVTPTGKETMLTKTTTTADEIHPTSVCIDLNKQLIDLYNNLTAITRILNETEINHKPIKYKGFIEEMSKSIETKDKNIDDERYRERRHFKLKKMKMFKGDKWNCKCKENMTMCKSCAASEAVISEIIIEFDHLSKFMKDHCSEIESYFWANPSGGKRLKESINNLNKTVNNYYKRVKEKCPEKAIEDSNLRVMRSIKGRNFYKYRRRRRHNNNDNVKMANVCSNVDDIKKDLQNLKRYCNDLNVHVTSNVKQSFNLLKKYSYSLDDVKEIKRDQNTQSVSPNDIRIAKIIDNQETSSLGSNLITVIDISQSYTTESEPNNLTQYDNNEMNMTTNILLDKLLPGTEADLNEYHTKSYYIDNNKVDKIKREITKDQLESPLISDTGGSFWHDYINKVVKNNVSSSKRNIDYYSFLNNKYNQILTTLRSTNNDIEKTSRVTSNWLTNTMHALNSIFQSKVIYPNVTTSSEAKSVKTLKKKLTTSKLFTANANELELAQSYVFNPNLNSLTYNLKDLLDIITAINHNKTHVNDKLIGNLEKKDFLHLTKSANRFVTPFNRIKSTKAKIVKKIHTKLNKIMKTRTKSTKRTKDYYKTIVIDKKIMKMMQDEPYTIMPTHTEQTNNTAIYLNIIQNKVKHGIEQESTQSIVNKPYSKRKATTKPSTVFNYINKKMMQIMKSLSGKTTLSSSTATMTLNTFATSDKLKKGKFVNKVSTATVDKKRSLSNAKAHTVDKHSTEDYRSLLMSIFKFETDLIADDVKMLPDIKDVPKSDEDTYNTNVQANHGLDESLRNRNLSDPWLTTRKRGILEKLAAKIGVKLSRTNMKDNERSTTGIQSISVMVTEKYAPVKRRCGKKYHKMVKPHHKVMTNHSPRDDIGGDQPMLINLHSTRETTEKPKMQNKCFKEVYDSNGQNHSYICDTQETYKQVLENYRRMNRENFECYVRNITCARYKPVPKSFVLDETSLKSLKTVCKRGSNDAHDKDDSQEVYEEDSDNDDDKRKHEQGIRWDWIRRKRSLLSFDYFELYQRDEDGVFKVKKEIPKRRDTVNRSKRSTDLSLLFEGLRNLPKFENDKDKILVMKGDSITLDCHTALKGWHDCDRHTPCEVTWNAERQEMLMYDNVAIEGEAISIHDVTTKNMGSYSCIKDNVLVRELFVVMLQLPEFHLVFTPSYFSGKCCTYKNLQAVNEQLAGEMCNKVLTWDRPYTVRIDEPVCLKRKNKKRTQIRSVGVLSVKAAYPTMHCSLQCRRDLHCSMTLLAATTIPPLLDIPVTIKSEKCNRTMPAVCPGTCHKWIISKTLSKKDSNNHHEYHRLASHMAPGDIDVVVICPSGYHLIAKYKICEACPLNTYAGYGTNKCLPCPHGSGTPEPGSATCHYVMLRQRRYEWRDFSSYYVVVVCSMVGACALAAIASVGAQCCKKAEQSKSGDDLTTLRMERESLRNWRRNVPSSSDTQRKRPPSPSKVILARFFKSTHSSRESQEDKFGLWKKKSRPPLPPIDFD